MSNDNIDATLIIQELLNRNKNLMFENAVLKAKLAQYEQLCAHFQEVLYGQTMR